MLKVLKTIELIFLPVFMCVHTGRRLQYGKSGKCPAWWPTASAPWDSDRPLSTMKHGEVTSIFKAM